MFQSSPFQNLFLFEYDFLSELEPQLTDNRIWERLSQRWKQRISPASMSSDSWWSRTVASVKCKMANILRQLNASTQRQMTLEHKPIDRVLTINYFGVSTASVRFCCESFADCSCCCCFLFDSITIGRQTYNVHARLNAMVRNTSLRPKPKIMTTAGKREFLPIHRILVINDSCNNNRLVHLVYNYIIQKVSVVCHWFYQQNNMKSRKLTSFFVLFIFYIYSIIIKKKCFFFLV